GFVPPRGYRIAMAKLPITVWQVVETADRALPLADVVDRFEIVHADDLSTRLAGPEAQRCHVAVVPGRRPDIASHLGEMARVWLGSAPFGEVRLAPDSGVKALVSALTLALNLAAARAMRRVDRNARSAPIRIDAPELGDFGLHFQPQWSIDGERLIGTEALLRWHGLDVPGLRAEALVADVESRGEMARVGDWVLARGIWQVAAWSDVWPRRARMAINVSLSQLDDVDLAARLDRLLIGQRAAVERFELELG